MFKSSIIGLSGISHGIAIALNIAGTCTVLALVILVNYDAAARGLFHKPFAGTYEVVQFAVVLIVFLQLPDVVRVDRLTRSDGLLTVLGPKYPRLAGFMRRAINLLSATFMALVAIAIFPDFMEKWHDQTFFGTRGVFEVPWWPLKLAILVSAVMCVIIFLLKVVLPTAKDGLVRMPEHEGPAE